MSEAAMDVEVVTDPQQLAERVAERLAEHIRSAVDLRGMAIVGLSGGPVPPPMFRRLAAMYLPWESVHLFQIDERVAPDGDPDRNAVAIETELLSRTPAMGHLMPVTAADLDAAAAEYAELLQGLAEGVLDVTHLGLGDDGHTASLIPGDPVMKITDQDVAVTDEYRGRRRMTLTYPAINRSRAIVWEVTGADKREAVKAVLGGGDVPGAQISQDNAVLVVTADAAPGDERLAP
jgi:6-phosphogluconolactonase